jgi:hypothetical protein
MLKEKKIFVGGGIDQDSDLRYLKPNMYRYALNVLTNNSNDGNVGCIENRKGNVQVNFNLPAGENKCVGACKDIKRNAIVYFIYNSLGGHSILRYNIKPKTIDKILYQEAVLNFQPDRIISSINIVDDLLYWTDGYFKKFTYDPATELIDSGFNPPRKINMLKAYNYTNGIIATPLYKYSAITEQVLDRIKYPPTQKPEAEYTDDINKKFNFLIGSLYQFAYVYVYDDNEKSVLGGISDIPLPEGQEYIDGKYSLKQPSQNNVINLKIHTGVEIVKQIELYVRKLNTGDWYLFDTIRKYNEDGDIIIPSDINYDYAHFNGYGFYNNEILIEADQKNLARPYDYIGQTVDNQIISNNRNIDGGVVENYDNTDINVKLDWETSQINFNNTVNIVNGILQGNYIWDGNLGFYILFTLPPLPTPDGLYEIYIDIEIDDGGVISQHILTYSTVLLPSDIYPFTLRDRLIAEIVDNGSYAWGSANPNEIYVFVAWLGGGVTNTYSNSYISAIKTINFISGFKKGFNHYFGIQYYDRASRSGAVNVSKDSNIYIPYDTETIYANLTLSFRDVHSIIAQIKHQPPEWATEYQWFYARQTPKFIQYYYTTSNLSPNGNIWINVNECLARLKTNKQNTVLSVWDFQKGDRIRFIATGKYPYPNEWWFFPEYVDTEIVDFDISSGNIIIQDIGYIAKRIKIPDTYNYGIVEIYRPRQTSDESFYYEFGDRYKIGSPHTDDRFHEGGVQNQDPLNPTTTPAICRFSNGDVYSRARYAVEPPVIPVETTLLSDYYQSDAIGMGKISAVIPDIKRQKYTKLRYSGQLLEDTRINNLSRFDFLNTQEIENEFGNITSLKQLGQTLKVLQENKNTSIDIGIQQLTGGAGDSIAVVSSTKILGSPRYSSLGYGCQHPESVMVNDRYMYFYDQNYGVFIRDAANGMQEISSLGMKSFFNRKSAEINNAYSSKVITSFNKRYNEVVVSFLITTVDNPRRVPIYTNETVCFCEDSNTWTTFMSYEKQGVGVDYMSNLGETFVTFMNGQLYLENEGAYGDFFEEQKEMIVDVVSNAEQEKVKVFSALGLTTNHNKIDVDGWQVESITIPATDENAIGQLTNILNGAFRYKEEALYADIPRDLNTPMSGSDNQKKANGRVMRGQVAVFRLKNTADDSVILYSTIIKSIPSELSK